MLEFHPSYSGDGGALHAHYGKQKTEAVLPKNNPGFLYDRRSYSLS